MCLVFWAVFTLLIDAYWQKRKNDACPFLTIPAKAISKRMNNHQFRSAYFTTFELDSGERIEFSLTDSLYGLIIEVDQGYLTYQGTHFISFEERTISPS